MNDRFKFRVWNKKVKKMYDVKSMSYIDGVIKRIEVQGDIGIAIFDEYGKHIDNCILMQCTGLKDKNGKLIYEGDIIKYLCRTVDEKFVKYITKWNDNIGQFYISKINPSEYDNWKDWHLARHDLDYEVIGNIYENKELLEDKGSDR